MSDIDPKGVLRAFFPNRHDQISGTISAWAKDPSPKMPGLRISIMENEAGRLWAPVSIVMESAIGSIRIFSMDHIPESMTWKAEPEDMKRYLIGLMDRIHWNLITEARKHQP